MKEINEYANKLFVTEDPNLNRILTSLTEQGIRNISVSPATGQCLTFLVQVRSPKNILEIGTLGGYSSLCMLKGLNGQGTLTSLELIESYGKLAHDNITQAGFGQQFQLYVCPAVDSLKQLIADKRQFDFFFIDADKESYVDYINYCIELAEEGALIVVDNVLAGGAVALENENYPLEIIKKRVQLVHEFNEYVAKHPQLFSTLLPIGDGLLCSVVKKARNERLKKQVPKR